MSDGVKWSDIDAETKGYREGFVATFRKHEGEVLLSEKGKPMLSRQKRPLKVSQQGFAAHYGIAEATFRRWLKGGDLATMASSDSKPAPRKPSKPRRKTPASDAPENLPDLMTKSSADELAAEVRHSLNQIELAKLTKLGWKYLDQAQERLSAIYDGAQKVAK